MEIMINECGKLYMYNFAKELILYFSIFVFEISKFSQLFQPGHFIPKFTTINWALCLPASCSAEDAARTLESVLKVYNGTVGVKFTVNVDPNMCYVKQKSQSYSKETIGVLYVFY